MKPWKLKTDIYPVELYLFPICSRDEARGYLVRRFPGINPEDYFRYDGGTVVLTHIPTSRKIFFLWLSAFDMSDPHTLGSLSHEISHIVGSIFRYLGVPLDDQCSNEGYAYFLGFLVIQCARLLSEKKKKKRKANK